MVQGIWGRLSRLLLVPLLGIFWGCTSYEARPLRPEESEIEFRSRTLSDPDLEGYLVQKSPRRPPPWDLEVLTLVAFYFHSDLDVARARVASADAAVVTGGALPNPTIGANPLYVKNAVSGVSPWVLGLNIDIPIETAGKRGYRIEEAERLGAAARLALGEAAWTVRSRLRTSLADHLLAAKELDLLREEVTARTEATDLTEKKLALGEVSRPDVHQAQIELAGSKLALRAAETKLSETRSVLASALGLPTKALEGVSLAWTDLESPPALESLPLSAVQRAGLLNRLDVQRTLAEYAAAEASLKIEIAKQYPDIHLGPGYEYDQGLNKFGIGFSATLPIFNQNGGPIAEAEARRREVGARFLSVQSRAIGDTEQALARYQGARSELAEAEGILKLLATREQSAKRAVDLGEDERLSLAGIRVQRSVGARGRLDALRKLQSALGALEDAVQRPLGPGGELPPLPPESPREGKRKAGDR